MYQTNFNRFKNKYASGWKMGDHKTLKQVFKLEFLALLLIILLGTFLRINGIGSSEFWYDEAYTGILTQMNTTDLREILKFDVHPPVYIFSLRLWTMAFGTSVTNIRLLSALMGILAIPAVYLLLSTLKSTKKQTALKLSIALVIAVNPFLVAYSQEARSYSLTVLVFIAYGNFYL